MSLGNVYTGAFFDGSGFPILYTASLFNKGGDDLYHLRTEGFFYFLDFGSLSCHDFSFFDFSVKCPENLGTGVDELSEVPGLGEESVKNHFEMLIAEKFDFTKMNNLSLLENNVSRNLLFFQTLRTNNGDGIFDKIIKNTKIPGLRDYFIAKKSSLAKIIPESQNYYEGMS